jgi:hypothetical protein
MTSSQVDLENCTECGGPLEEAEFAIGDICDSCRPAYMADWKTSQEAEAEADAESRRYSEESDDDVVRCGLGSCLRLYGTCEHTHSIN